MGTDLQINDSKSEAVTWKLYEKVDKLIQQILKN